LLATEDCLAALNWAESIGGLSGLKGRSQANLAVVEEWIAKTDWAEFMCADPSNRSSTAICIKVSDADFNALPDDKAKWAFVKTMTGMLDAEGVAYDIDGYRDAPPSIRIWGGATVESSDIAALLPWLDWAFASAKEQMARAA
jgi:phosphoserine aminotransferase